MASSASGGCTPGMMRVGGRSSASSCSHRRGEGDVAPARHHVVRQCADALLGGFVADLRAAQHDEHVGRQHLELRHQPRRLLHVPDVDAEADDAGPLGQQFFRDFLGFLADDEFADRTSFPQTAEVGAQAAQAERGVRVAGVQGGQNDVGHASLSPGPRPGAINTTFQVIFLLHAGVSCATVLIACPRPSGVPPGRTSDSSKENYGHC